MMPKRIDLSLFTEELRTLINAAAKIFPVEYSLIESGQNPNNYEYVRIMSGEHKREIYHWDEELKEWGLIGADDFDITWDDIDGKPLRFSLDRGDLWDTRPAQETKSGDFTYKKLIELVGKKD
ncbi:MAG TPA: hypothetical protein PK684_06025, partial [Bacillota bacterium]|nr:hypothetical protein [Bacillota bacterium]